MDTKRSMKSFRANLGTSWLERREHFWPAGILLLALALRVWDLGARSLWFDEASEYWVAVAPTSQLAHFVSLGSGDPPLYAFLLHFWMKLGTGEAWLRALSVVASLAGVAGLMVLGRRLAGSSAAITVGLLAAVNPPDIRYAQEVGQYALMVGTVAWSLIALHGLWNEGGRKWIVAWSLLAFGATASYYAAVFPVLVPFGCAFVEALVRRDRARAVRFAVALGIYVAVTTPVLWAVLPDQWSRVLVTRERVATFDQQRPEGLALVWRWLGNLFAFHFSGWPYTRVPAWVPIAGWFVLLALALRARPRWVLWFAAAWAAYGVTGLFELFPFGFRWGLILWPFVILLAGVGVAAGTRERWVKPVGAIAFASLVVSGVVTLPNRTVRDAFGGDFTLLWPETEDVRPVVEYWHARRSRLQPTYVFYGAAPAFSYYLQRYPDTRGGLPPVWTLTCWGEENPPAFCSRDNIYYGRWLRSLDPMEKAKSMYETLGFPPREFWIVFSHVQGVESSEIIQIMQQSGYTVADWIERRAAGAVLLQRQ
jgi:hypothetical protein